MTAPRDPALFPQSLLRFLVSCERLGTPPAEALTMFLSGFRLHGRVRERLHVLSRELRAGNTLAAQMAAYPDLFPQWLPPLVEWGQKSGQTAESLEFAAAELDRQASVGRSIQLMLAYPMVLIGISAMLAIFISGTVATQFHQVELSLPAATMANFDREWPLAGLIARFFFATGTDWLITFVVAMVTLIVALIIAMPRKGGYRPVHNAVRRLVPGIGRVEEFAHESLSARLIASGLTVNVPLVELLEQVAPVAGTPARTAVFQDAARRIRQGVPPGEALQQAGGDASFISTLGAAVGMPDPVPVLKRLASASADRAAVESARLSRIAAPILALATAAVVAILPAGQYLSLIRITSALGHN